MLYEKKLFIQVWGFREARSSFRIVAFEFQTKKHTLRAVIDFDAWAVAEKFHRGNGEFFMRSVTPGIGSIFSTSLFLVHANFI